MSRKIRVLVITYPFWREDDNLGNSYSNIFRGMDDKFEFAHIYCKDNMPKNSLCHKYYHLSEKQLIKSVFTRRKVANSFVLNDPMDTPDIINSANYDKARAMRWEIFLMARDFLVTWGQWKSDELNKFIESFKPDVIFGSLTYIPLINNIMVYVSRKYNIPLVPYSWDDFYSLKRKSFSLTYWIRFLIERRYIRKTVLQSTYMYTITKQMQEEYSQLFDKECRLLYKGHLFEGDMPINIKQQYPLKLIYMGNIGGGRWKVLEELAKAIEELNQNGQKMELLVYTMSPKTLDIISSLTIEGACRIMSPVPQSEVMTIMKSADILVHVEPTSLKEMYFYRLSFSTKLVDYFYNARCVLAVGGETASLAYLRDNDAGIVENNPAKFRGILKQIIDTPPLIEQYARNAWNCGKRNHQITEIQNMIYNDFKILIDERK